ncbi:hypothetical protein D3C87_1986440 [compost metagenome]
MYGCKLLLVESRRLRHLRVDGDNGGVMPRPHLPDVQVGDAIFFRFHAFTNFLRQVLRQRNRINQRRCRGANESP